MKRTNHGIIVTDPGSPRATATWPGWAVRWLAEQSDWGGPLLDPAIVREASIEALREAHWVLCGADKAPVRRWKSVRPGVGECVDHLRGGGLLGVVPASIGAGVVDVDRGEPAEVEERIGPAVLRLRTRREGGAHCWYPDGGSPWGNERWSAGSASGELRGGRGYVCLHHPGESLPVLTRAVSEGRFLGAAPDLQPILQGARTFPEEPGAEPGVRLETGVEAALQDGPADLFRRLCRATWALGPAPLGEPEQAVESVAALPPARAMLAAGCPPEELRRVVLYILERRTGWNWGAWRTPWTHDSEAQRRRGVRWGEVRRARNADRDAAIRALHAEGLSPRVIGQRFGVSPRTVFRICANSPGICEE